MRHLDESSSEAQPGVGRWLSLPHVATVAAAQPAGGFARLLTNSFPQMGRCRPPTGRWAPGPTCPLRIDQNCGAGVGGLGLAPSSQGSRGLHGLCPLLTREGGATPVLQSLGGLN